jgi:hypothetical protein
MAFGSTPADSNNIPIGCVYVPGTGFKALQGGAKLFTDASSNDSAPVAVSQVGGQKATYTYSIVATAPYATPTDWIVLRGSATKLVKVVRFSFSGVATAATSIVFTLQKHTTANTSGTATQPAPMLHDSSDAAASAVIELYSVAPTITAGLPFRTIRYDLAVVPAASAVVTDRFVEYYGLHLEEPLTLRGVAQEMAVNFAGAAIPSGGLYDLSITWTEE